MKTLKEALAVAYLKYDTPADKLAIGEPDVKQQFADEVNADLPPSERLSPDVLIWTLLNLRKTGDLPRLRRRYSGRNGKATKPSDN